MSHEPEFSATEVVRLTGVTYRQLDYWDRTELVCPVLPATGSGSARRYSAADVVKVKAIGALLAAGLSLPCVRRALTSATSLLDLADLCRDVSADLDRVA